MKQAFLTHGSLGKVVCLIETNTLSHWKFFRLGGGRRFALTKVILNRLKQTWSYNNLTTSKNQLHLGNSKNTATSILKLIVCECQILFLLWHIHKFHICGQNTFFLIRKHINIEFQEVYEKIFQLPPLCMLLRKKRLYHNTTTYKLLIGTCKSLCNLKTTYLDLQIASHRPKLF